MPETEPLAEPQLTPEPEPEPAPEKEPQVEPKPIPEPEQESVQIADQTSPALPTNDAPSDNKPDSGSTNAPSELNLAASQQAALREQLYDTYLSALMQALRSRFDYPRGALRRRQEGRVEIALRIETDGSITGITLDTSSGYTLLDESAVAMIESISGLPALPEAAGDQGLA
jgi:protein TonB